MSDLATLGSKLEAYALELRLGREQMDRLKAWHLAPVGTQTKIEQTTANNQDDLSRFGAGTALARPDPGWDETSGP